MIFLLGPGADRDRRSSLHRAGLRRPSHATMRFLRRRTTRYSIVVATLVVTGCASSSSPTESRPIPGIDVGDLFTWTQAQKVARFPRMDSLFPSHVVGRGGAVRELPTGAPLAALAAGTDGLRTLNEVMVSQQIAGLLVVQDGRIRVERYALGASATSRWTSFSVAKSLTSMLVGAAIKDGYISGLDAFITQYIPELRGTAYEGVTVRHLLTMTSGIAWNEDYSDPNSDISRYTRYVPVPGLDATVGFVRTLRRESPPGTRWVYKTPETNLIGALVIAATGKSLATYLSEKIWSPYGMDRDATWLVDHVGHEQGGCCLQASLRDFARIGQFVLDGGRVNGQLIVPAGWIEASTRKQFDIGVAGRGYGYQWWTTDDGTFEARGLYGQLIHVDPARKLVIVISGAWTTAVGGDAEPGQRTLVAGFAAALDAEAAGAR